MFNDKTEKIILIKIPQIAREKKDLHLLKTIS